MEAIESQHGVIKGLEELKSEPVEMDMSLLYVVWVSENNRIIPS